MVIETSRLTIIPCMPETIHIVNEQKYYDGPQIENYMKRLEEDSSQLYWGVWLVTEKVDGILVGDIGFKGKPNADGVVEVGYGFLESARMKGYATESVGALVDWAFRQEEVTCVIAETLHDNAASIRVLEKIGMKRVSETEKMVNWEIV